MPECLEDSDPNGDVTVDEIVTKLLEAKQIDAEFAAELRELCDEDAGSVVENFYTIWYSNGKEGDPQVILEELNLV